MASFRFAILKELDRAEIVEITDKEFLEYDSEIFKAKLIAETARIASLDDFGVKGKPKKEKLYKQADIESVVKKAFDNIVSELKKQTVRAK